MPTARITRRADRGARAVRRVALIEAEIAALAGEDLLDLAHIFVTAPSSLLGTIASAETMKRGLSLD